MVIYLYTSYLLFVFERGKKHGHNFVYEELRRLIKQRDKRAKLMSSKFYLDVLLMIYTN